MLWEILFSWPALPEMSFSLWMPGWSSIHSAHSLLTHCPPSEELVIPSSTQALHFEHGFCSWVFLSFLVCLPQCYPEGNNHDLAISDSFPFITVGTICSIFWIRSNWCKFETRLFWILRRCSNNWEWPGSYRICPRCHQRMYNLVGKGAQQNQGCHNEIN